jgi:serine/threonine protein kinase
LMMGNDNQDLTHNHKGNQSIFHNNSTPSGDFEIMKEARLQSMNLANQFGQQTVMVPVEENYDMDEAGSDDGDNRDAMTSMAMMMMLEPDESMLAPSDPLSSEPSVPPISSMEPHDYTHVSANQVDIPFEGCSYQWVEVQGEPQERRLVAISNPAPPTTTVHCCYDMDFGFRVHVPQLILNVDSNGICNYQPSSSPRRVPFYVVRCRRSRSNLATFSPYYQKIPTNESSFRWIFAEGDVSYIYGIVTTKNFVLTHISSALIKRSDTTFYENRSIVSLSEEGKPNSLYLDMYDAINKHLHGEFVQENSLGEVYLGMVYPIIYRYNYDNANNNHDNNTNNTNYDINNGRTMLLRENGQRLAMKLIRCACSKDSLSTSTVRDYLQQDLSLRNENFVHEIEAMAYLSTVSLSLQTVLGDGRGNPRQIVDQLHSEGNPTCVFQHYTALLHIPEICIMIASEYAEDRCVLSYAMKHRQQWGGRLDEVDAKCLFVQVAHTLQVMHKHRLAHQDISPENFLLKRLSLKGATSTLSTPTPTTAPPLQHMLCVLIDFGQSVAVPVSGRVKSKTDRPVGKSVCYAPELVQAKKKNALLGQEYDAFAVDVFQLGISLYIMLFGNSPYPLKGNVDANREIFFNLLSSGQEKVRCNLAQLKTISVDCLDLLVKLLSFSPHERPTISQVLEHKWCHGL